MEKNLKDIIANGRGNWLGKEKDKKDFQNNCQLSKDSNTFFVDG